MKDEDKIFGLIAQAEDIQAHAVKLQQAAQEAVKTLPDATREAVRVQAREIITEASKNASEGLLRASNERLRQSAPSCAAHGFYMAFFCWLSPV